MDAFFLSPKPKLPPLSETKRKQYPINSFAINQHNRRLGFVSFFVLGPERNHNREGEFWCEGGARLAHSLAHLLLLLLFFVSLQGCGGEGEVRKLFLVRFGIPAKVKGKKGEGESGNSE